MKPINRTEAEDKMEIAWKYVDLKKKYDKLLKVSKEVYRVLNDPINEMPSDTTALINQLEEAIKGADYGI